MQKILQQDTDIAVNIYRGQITNYNSVDVRIFYVYAIFLMSSDKMLVQCKLYSHIMELDHDVCGSSTAHTAVARVQCSKLF